MTGSRASLTSSLRALEVIRDDGARRLIDAGQITTAAAHVAIIDNVIRCALDLAFAAKAAANGNAEPARQAGRDLRLDEVEIQ